MRLGANTVLFGGFDMETAFKCLAMAGYDGIEVSAIDGMSEHLVISRWREIAPEVKRLAADYALELLAMEQPSRAPAIMEEAFRAAAEIGIPVINCGPGGKADDEASLQQTIDSLGSLADMAGQYTGADTLCGAVVRVKQYRGGIGGQCSAELLFKFNHLIITGRFSQSFFNHRLERAPVVKSTYDKDTVGRGNLL